MSHLSGRHRIMGSLHKGALVMTVLEVGCVLLDLRIGVASKVDKNQAGDDLSWRS